MVPFLSDSVKVARITRYSPSLDGRSQGEFSSATASQFSSVAVILIWMAVPKPFRVTSFVSGDNSVLTPFWMTVISLFSFPEVTLIFAVRSVFQRIRLLLF